MFACGLLSPHAVTRQGRRSAPCIRVTARRRPRKPRVLHRAARVLGTKWGAQLCGFDARHLDIKPKPWCTSHPPVARWPFVSRILVAEAHTLRPVTRCTSNRGCALAEGTGMSSRIASRLCALSTCRRHVPAVAVDAHSTHGVLAAQANKRHLDTAASWCTEQAPRAAVALPLRTLG